MTDLRNIVSAFWDGEILWDCPMARFSTLRVGGPAAALVEPASMADLERLVRGLQERGLPWYVVGGGSNILVREAGFAGVVIHLGRKFAAISEPLADGERMEVSVAAGCSLTRLAGWCAEQGVSGLEFASGIPGTVGGAVVMNAGAWGGEMAQVVAAVTVVDPRGEVAELEREEIPFSYRSWGLSDLVVAEVTFSLGRGERKDIEAVSRELAGRRRELQPLSLPSAGSFFKNPPGDAAGRLIERAGLKGFQVGGAMVSPLHANFLVNVGEATADDFIALMEVVRKKVLAMSGVWLEPEVHIIGPAA